MENNPGQDRIGKPLVRQSHKRGLSGLIPWLGGLFWLVLWVWLALPHQKIDVPKEEVLLSRTAPGLQLKGFRIRQQTTYTNQRFTYLDLEADRGWNLEGDEDSHLLVNVRVRLVSQGDIQPSTKEQSLGDLSARADVAWVLIEGATGIYSFKTRNIDLIGNVQVFGYTKDGELVEWIAAERLFYDWKAGMVRSVSPATYEGHSLQIGQPYKCFVETDVDLSEINISDLEPLGEEMKTPIRFPELRPPYAPPEALKFLNETNPS